MGIENINNFKRKLELESSDVLLINCDISTRAYQSLKGMGIFNLTDLINYSEEEIITMLPSINQKTIEEIKDLLFKYNLDFKHSEL